MKPAVASSRLSARSPRKNSLQMRWAGSSKIWRTNWMARRPTKPRSYGWQHEIMTRQDGSRPPSLQNRPLWLPKLLKPGRRQGASQTFRSFSLISKKSWNWSINIFRSFHPAIILTTHCWIILNQGWRPRMSRRSSMAYDPNRWNWSKRLPPVNRSRMTSCSSDITKRN